MGADYARAVKEHLVDLLIRDDELVALIEMIAASDHLLIENVAVAPALQGQGLGRRMMAHAEDVAHERGVGELRLYTHHRFAENIRLYEALGYAIESREPIPDGFKVNMRKRL